jgi:hypothetical protein
MNSALKGRITGFASAIPELQSTGFLPGGGKGGMVAVLSSRRSRGRLFQMERLLTTHVVGNH